MPKNICESQIKSLVGTLKLLKALQYFFADRSNVVLLFRRFYLLFVFVSAILSFLFPTALMSPVR